MNRRGFGRPRFLAAAGALLALLGCFLPWYRVGGDGGLPPVSAAAFEGAGILVFLAAIAVLALLALPYAAGDRPLSVDRPASFVLVASVGVAGLALRLLQLWGDHALGLPDRALGLWVATAGLAILTWGVAEMVGQP